MIVQQPGVAQNAPYLYFTAVAMDAPPGTTRSGWWTAWSRRSDKGGTGRSVTSCNRLT